MTRLTPLVPSILLLLSACTPSVGDVVWYGDLQSTVQSECLGCHGEGGLGGVVLADYEGAAALAERMASRTTARTMPPWNPADDPDCPDILDDRHLSDEEVLRFGAWAEQGAPEGDPALSTEAPSLDTLSDASVTLDIGADYTPNDQGQNDDYHCFILDPNLAADAFVTAIETLPDVDRMVHHVLYHAVDQADAEAADAAGMGPGWTCFGGPGNFDSQLIGGWVPGQGVLRYPEGTGIRMEAGQVIVVQYHYNFDTGPAVPDRSGAAFRFEPQVDRAATITRIADPDFAIPPGAKGHTSEATLGPINDAGGNAVWAVAPHMHQLGASIRTGLYRGNQDLCLVDIPEWDFNWQQFYFFEQPFELEDGDTAYLSCTWDNPTGATVTWGEGTSDEMCIAYAYVSAL